MSDSSGFWSTTETSDGSTTLLTACGLHPQEHVPPVLTEGPGGPTRPAAPGKPVAPWQKRMKKSGEEPPNSPAAPPPKMGLRESQHGAVRYSQGGRHCHEHLWVQEHQRYPVEEQRGVKARPVLGPGLPAARGPEDEILTIGPGGPAAPAGPGGPASPLAPASPGSPLAPGWPSAPWGRREGGERGEGYARVGSRVTPQGWGRTVTQTGHRPFAFSFLSSGRCLCPHPVPQGPGTQLVMENERGLGTYRGASEASRARGTRLTTVSLEEKEQTGERS